MEKYLFKLFELADSLNQNQNKVFAQIIYYADNNKTIEIIIKSKKDSHNIERCQTQLKDNPCKKLKIITDLFNTYVGGDSNE